MQNNSLWILAILGTAAAFAGSNAAAAEQAVTAESGRYGSPATHMPFDQEIRLGADTRSVTVRRLDTVKFVTGDGRDFTWRFDTERPDTFPLTRIAPPGASVPSSATVYVLTEIPIAP